MEILIERKDVFYLRSKAYDKAEVILLGDELRIYLHNQGQRTVYVMIEPAIESDVVQIKQWLVNS